MEQNLLVGNGINIQFGGFDQYSGSAIMNRVVENIKAGKYTALTENMLSTDEQLGLLDDIVKVIDHIKAGKAMINGDHYVMIAEMDRIKRTYPINSSINSVFLEDYFLAFETSNNAFKVKDGEELNEEYRKIFFAFLRQIFLDGIYNDGAINEVYKNFYPKINTYLGKFNNIFTINYDYNLENALGNSCKVHHLHGEFGKLSPKYDVNSIYYASNKKECDNLISKKVPNMEHIYSDAIMSWSWLDKYGEIISPDANDREKFFTSIHGRLEILGLSPANDEHLFLLINLNPNIKSITYYYFKDEDRTEFMQRIPNKPVTYKKVEKLWASMK